MSEDDNSLTESSGRNGREDDESRLPPAKPEIGATHSVKESEV